MNLEAGRGRWEVEFGSARVVFGQATLDRLGPLVRDLGCLRVFLVTDAGIVKAGHVERAVRALEEKGCAVRVFDGVEENPSTRHVAEAAQVAGEMGTDCIVGLGGGSAMDCAKGVNFVLTQGGRIEDFRGFGLARKPMLPSIGIPTTAGTGSEAQSFALISREDSHAKMACGDRKAKFRAVILDPALTLTLPRAVTAATGMDAVSHALESYVSTRGNPVSRMMAKEAWRLVEGSFPTVLESSQDAGARGRMLLGAHLAGAAIEHSMLGAAHACANPLTARFGVTHGIAVGLMLPHVIRFNGPEVGGLYGELSDGADDGGGGLAARTGELLSAAGLPGKLRDCSIPRKALSGLAEEAAQQWTLEFNPRKATRKELLELYEAAY